MKLDPSLKQTYPKVSVGYAIVRNVKVEKKVKGLEECKEEVFKKLKEEYGTAAITLIPEVVLYRTFFRSMGVDPSRQRPPTEYLLRKALSDRFPSINNVVDSCLLATVENWVVVAVFDLDKIKGEPVVTVETEVETFELIDGRQVSPAIGDILLRDDEKIISAYTVGDAKECMITPETKNVLVIAWNCPGIGKQKVEESLKTATDYLSKFCKGTVVEMKMFE